jgi:YfiH family protein
VPRTKTSASRTTIRKRAARVTRSGLPALLSKWWLHRSQGLQILQLAPFAKLPWLVHGFSTSTGGVSELHDQKVLNLGFQEWDSRENVIANRQRFQSALGAKDLTLAPLKQIHSDVIQLFSANSTKSCSGDASTTSHPGLLLGIQTADCVPILLIDPKKRAVAAIHAGWRGTLARITEKAIGRMRLEFASQPRDILAAIGPSIGPCCYEVGADLVTKFTAQFPDGADYFDEPLSGEEPNPLQWLNMRPPGHQPAPKNVRLDLRKANRSQLEKGGVRPQNIFSCDLCTACNSSLLFSYRKQGAVSGRLMAVIGIRKK